MIEKFKIFQNLMKSMKFMHFFEKIFVFLDYFSVFHPTVFTEVESQL